MNLKALLAVSLVVNLALAATIAWMAKRHPTRSAETQAAETPTAVAPKTKPAMLDVASPAAPEKSFDWRMVESEDYRKYIANLRAIGCPEETIRDIIIADVNKLFASRKQALKTSTNKFEFWKAGNIFVDAMDPDRIEKAQELAREKRALLKELLGVAPEEKPDLLAGFDPFGSMLDFLPAAKQTEVMELFQKLQARMMKSFNGGTPDAEDLKLIQKSQKEMEAELAKILTPQELEDYQLRMSQTAMMMRMQLTSFEPTEQEFRQIFAQKKKFDDEFNPMGLGTGSLDKAEREKMNAAKQEMDSQLKSILGDARYVEYVRAQDWAYQGIYRVTERQGLPKDAAVKVYDMKRIAEEQARKIRQDQALTKEQRTAALHGIRAETENSIKAVFGDKGFESYQKQPGAYWLKNISP